MSKKRLRKEFDELERRLQTAFKLQNYNEQSDIQLELAELLKETDSENAIDYYESALKSSKRARNHRNTILAYRNLGEIHINLAGTAEDYQRAFRYLKQQLEHAEEVNDHGLIQLALHTLSQSYAAEAQNFGQESINMTKALFYGRACFDYLNKHKDDIDADTKAIKTDANSSRRCAGINSVLADIYIKFGATKKALNHIGASIDYALRNNVKSEPLFLYQCYFVKLELMREIACLELTETMRIHANKNKIKENRDILERKYYMYLLTCNPTDTSKLCDVIEYFLKQREARDTSSIEYVDVVLKFLHLLVNFKRRFDATITNNDRSLIYEEMGDQACNAEFFELGVDYYRKMLYYAEKDQNKERIYLACSSIVETARNLHDYKEARRYQEQALNLARELYPNDKDKIFFDECDLFYLEVRNGYNGTANKEEQYQQFLSILQKCETNRKKSTVLDEFVLFLAFYADKSGLERWTKELETSNRLKESEPSITVYEEKDQPSLSSSERYSLREFVTNNRDKKAREDISWKNTKGESRLHEASKIDDANELRKLIESGQNVNAKDYAGWSPLMEAVSYGHLNNVRVLCQSGADVNAASSEGLVDDDGNVGPSGITPIMDACATGKIQIARVLMRLGSDLNLRNENNETAADLLRNYIEVNKPQLSATEILQCNALLTDLEKKTRKRASPMTSASVHESDTSQENIKRFCSGYNFSA